MTSPHCKKCYSARLRFPTLDFIEVASLVTEEYSLGEDVCVSDSEIFELCRELDFRSGFLGRFADNVGPNLLPSA